MREDGLQNLTPTGHIEGQRNRGKHRIIYVTTIWKWMAEHNLGEIAKIENSILVTKDMSFWRAMVANFLSVI